MQCEHVQNQLAAYLDGRLSPEEQAEIASHLATCGVCSEEAAFMKQFGERISAGLKDWVAQGAVPAAVMARIEESVRATRKKPWWQRWPAYASVAAVLLVVVLGARADLSGQLASLPLVGTVVSQLFRGNDGFDPSSGIATDLQEGLMLVLLQVTPGDQELRLEYVVRGTNLDALAPENRFTPVLTGPEGQVALRELKASRGKHEVRITAAFAPVPAGQEYLLSIANLPVRNQGTGLTGGKEILIEGPWQVPVRP